MKLRGSEGYRDVEKPPFFGHHGVDPARGVHCTVVRDADRSDANAAGWNRRREGPPHGDQRPYRHLRGRYSQGRQYAARLDRIESQIRTATGPKVEEIQHQFEALRREALLANPLLSGQPLLFVVRAQYAPDHHNTETMFQTGEINTGSFRGGGALKFLALPHIAPRSGPAAQAAAAADPSVTTVYEVPKGIVRDPDVSFDGKKNPLLNAAGRRRRLSPVTRSTADGTHLKQLTFGQGVSDIDPIYLPNGQILFTSTREPKYCMCNRHIMGNLFTMEADGANIQQIGHSTLHEGHASLLPDGRVIYDRWEYVDRNFGNAQGLWTTNPDGTNHVVYYGNSTESPGAKLEARAIPDTEAGDLHLLVVPRPTLGGPGDSRPAAWAWMAVPRCCGPGPLPPSTWLTTGDSTRLVAFNPSTRTPTRFRPSISFARG